MLAIAVVVLFAIAQAQTAQAAAERAAAVRRRAAAALAAKAQADDASEEALAELDRVRAYNAAHLAAYQTATERAHAELDEVRGAAAKAVTDAQKIAEAAIQKVIADRDRILAQRAADMHQQIDRAKVDAQAQVKVLQNQLDAAKAEAEQLAKSMHGELAYPTAVTRAESEKANTERVAELDQEATVTQQRAQAGQAASRARSPSGHRKSKMTPELIDKAQRMYNSRRFTIAEIAKTCAVSPTTVYRHIRTNQITTH
jgi:helix-turn-helix resolvase-like protein